MFTEAGCAAANLSRRLRELDRDTGDHYRIGTAGVLDFDEHVPRPDVGVGENIGDGVYRTYRYVPSQDVDHFARGVAASPVADDAARVIGVFRT